MDPNFFIAFTDSSLASPFEAFARFFDRLVKEKQYLETAGDFDFALKSIIREPVWIDFFDESTLSRVTSSSSWELEDILETVLCGEYHLVSLKFDGVAGQLVYEPWSFPFGGTDVLKVVVRLFGFEVVRDSFWDGYDEWLSKST
ncbi:MAG: hypothetical protein KDA84_07070 [Planctomycetaceae bacterium]|nr:hypothetical protein [Planctomycetaceae bacterium]